MTIATKKKVAIIVAHPDDETLWAGGTIIKNREWNCFILCLSRAGDRNRSAKFRKTLHVLKSKGVMADLPDNPNQPPLQNNEVESEILKNLPSIHFDLIITHNPTGEYTRHIRHEEVSRAVINLWHSGKIKTNELWTFAYEDGHKAYYPKPIKNGTLYFVLGKAILKCKHSIITKTYGFKTNSFEAHSVKRAEAFWQFTQAADAQKWLEHGGAFKI
jgi:LmbE family N-acetylglucosaminyl deacetylase